MNLLDLYAKITLDDSEYHEKVGLAETAGHKLADGLKSGFKTVSKLTVAGISAGAAGVTALAKSATNSYAEYEQLVGGVETLFEKSAGVVQAYADSAYQSAGMSANEYMNTVTSFSASLLQSLGGDTLKAAVYANRAVTDMSDNANKMGTDISMIQNAYQGFAKQNYTMLDNLKLGYGGTQKEMMRLLEDAEKISGVEYDMSSYADIVDAIHVIQTEMGITGTTAREASSTIQGSAASMKAAWENLLTGMADENADLDTLLLNFVDSVTVYGENLIPRVEQILGGVGTVFDKFGETLLPQVVEKIMEHLPSIIEAGADLIINLGLGLANALPGFIDQVPEIVSSIVSKLEEKWPAIKEAGKNLGRELWEGLKELMDEIGKKVSQWVEGIVAKIKGNADDDAQMGVFGSYATERMNASKYTSGSAKEADWDVGNVDFANSALGMSSAAMANAFNSGRGKTNASITANLVLPDNTQLAQYYLPSFIDVAKANGTPILNPSNG